jgi:hypothetical protein
MKIHRIQKNEHLGYCHGCHNRAAFELIFSSFRSPLRLCEVCEARHLIKELAARLNDQRQWLKDQNEILPLGGPISEHQESDQGRY